MIGIRKLGGSARMVDFRARWGDRTIIVAGQLAVLVVWLTAWELIGRRDALLLSYPTQVLGALVEMVQTSELQGLFAFTGRTFLFGWAIAAVAGLTFGALIGAFRPVALMFEPFVNALYATPKIVLIPLMVLWFGIGLNAYVASVAIGAVFPMMIMTITGVRNAGREYVDVARSFGVKGLQLLWKVVVPGALPFIFVGMRLSMGRAIGGAIAAEFFLGGGGIGGAVQAAGLAFASAQMYGLILIIFGSVMAVDIGFRRVWNALSPVRP